jgi:hypothetical protein
MGNWTLEANQRQDLTLEQTFRRSTARGDSRGAAGLRTRLRGPFIQFSYVGQDGVRRDFNGRVSGARWKAASGTRKAARASGPPPK